MATSQDDGSLELVVNFNAFKQTRQFVFVHGPNNALRAVYNRDVDSGSLSIRDGKFVSNGEPTPWQYRCD